MCKLKSLVKLKDKSLKNKHLNESIETINNVLASYSYNQMAFCFNGGKDCTALLFLLLSLLNSRPNYNNNLEIWCIDLPGEFVELKNFRVELSKKYTN